MAAHSKTKPRQFRTQVNIPAEKRTALIELLNQSLASIFDLYSQTKQAHWNVKGKEFYQLHVLFDEIAGELAEFSDVIAERVTSLGGYGAGTVRMSAEGSILPEYPLDAVEGKRHVDAAGGALRRRSPITSARRSTAPTSWATSAPSDLYTEIGRDRGQAALVPRGPHPGSRVSDESRGRSGHSRRSGLERPTRTQARSSDIRPIAPSKAYS